ncbi:helix-turn-helix domain-containing protein [Streptomyces sp. NBC_01643]|uniref:helix-turn-helix domain-containing protein n=1 Tax=Streptomyces sp. NBC_01643 TaxID=2975906 RepID=UPI00386EE1C4|nr:ImmA/IrrE family metallo-endopeptidase [Streptomyces sp. NBC_01643]
MDLKEIGRRVTLERSHAGMTQRELADRAELSQPTLNRIEAGERAALTIAELDRLALALDVPLTRLTRGNPVGERMKVAARAGQQMLEDLQSASRRAEEILALDDRMDAFALPTGIHGPGQLPVLLCKLPTATLPAEDQGRLLAEAVREKLALGLGPVLDLAELAESPMGLDTAALDLPDGVSGITARDPGRGVVLVLINTAHVPERQRFTLAHELGHVLFGDGAEAHLLDGEPTLAETRCNSFARHLLAPSQGVARWLAENTDGTPGLKECAMAARHYEVSLKVILIQCQKLGLLTARAAEALGGWTGRQLAWAYGWGPQYAAACDAAARVRPPRRILERAVEAYRAGRIGVRAVAALGGEDPRTTERELREAGITPPTARPPRRVDVASLIARRTAGGGEGSGLPAMGNGDGDSQE